MSRWEWWGGAVGGRRGEAKLRLCRHRRHSGAYGAARRPPTAPLLLLLLLACVKKPSSPASEPLPAYRGIFILNEGQWTLGNASLDLLAPDSTFYEDVFFAVNRQSLGDVANHMLRQGDTLWITMNGSRLLWGVHLPSLQVRLRLGFPPSASPRMYLPLTPRKAYVNSLLDSTVYRMDPQRGILTPPHIRIENFSESMVYHAGQVWVTCGNYAYPLRNWKVACIDPERDSVRFYIDLPRENPGPLIALPSGELLIGCRGNYADQKGMLVHIEPNTRNITRTVELRTSVYSLQRYGDEVFMLTDSGVSRYMWRSGVVDYSFMSKSRYGIGEHELLYGFFYDSLSGVWLLANARAGGVQGEVIFVRDGQVIRRQPTGVFPAKFLRYP